MIHQKVFVSSGKQFRQLGLLGAGSVTVLGDQIIFIPSKSEYFWTNKLLHAIAINSNVVRACPIQIACSSNRIPVVLATRAYLLALNSNLTDRPVYFCRTIARSAV